MKASSASEQSAFPTSVRIFWRDSVSMEDARSVSVTPFANWDLRTARRREAWISMGSSSKWMFVMKLLIRIKKAVVKKKTVKETPLAKKSPGLGLRVGLRTLSCCGDRVADFGVVLTDASS